MRLPEAAAKALEGVAGPNLAKIVGGFEGRHSPEAVAELLAPLGDPVTPEESAPPPAPPAISKEHAETVEALRAALSGTGDLSETASDNLLFARRIPAHLTLDAAEPAKVEAFFDAAEAIGAALEKPAPTKEDALSQIMAEQERVDVEGTVSLAALAVLLGHEVLRRCHPPDRFTTQP